MNNIVEFRPDANGGGGAWLNDGTYVGAWHQIPNGGWYCEDAAGADLTQNPYGWYPDENDVKALLEQHGQDLAAAQARRTA